MGVVIVVVVVTGGKQSQLLVWILDLDWSLTKRKFSFIAKACFNIMIIGKDVSGLSYYYWLSACNSKVSIFTVLKVALHENVVKFHHQCNSELKAWYLSWSQDQNTQDTCICSFCCKECRGKNLVKNSQGQQMEMISVVAACSGKYIVPPRKHP